MNKRIPKITPYSVCGKLSAPEKPTLVFRVTGVVKKVQTVVDALPKLKGEFAAENVYTGEKFVSNNAYLPLVISNPIVAEALANPNRDIEFGFEVGIVPTDKYSDGYEFGANKAFLRAADTLERLSAELADFGSQEKSD